jgi:hypothetical protein
VQGKPTSAITKRKVNPPLSTAKTEETPLLGHMKLRRESCRFLFARVGRQRRAQKVRCPRPLFPYPKGVL